MKFPEKAESIPIIFAKNPPYAEGTLAQIEKDFRLQGLSIRIPRATVPYDQLVELIANYLKNSGLLHSPKFISLLYQLDLNESKMRAILANTPPESMHVALADQIIKRCFTKVYWRLNSK